MSHTTRLGLVAAIGLCTLGGLLAATPGDDAVAAKKPDCCDELRKRIEQLEQRLQQLEARVPITPAPRYALPKPGPDSRPELPFIFPPKSPQPDDLPPGAVPREFNGMRYYIVPLERGERGRSQDP